MDKELRILILEDNPADAELEEHELRKSGLVFTSKVVDTKAAFLKALEEFLPDLILADYELPSFDGLAALRIAQEKCPDVPFILVTGKLGEEFAIDKLKDGATDYVIKNNLQRLVPSVNRALEEANEITERKQAYKALRESEERFRQIAESAEEWIWEIDVNGLYTYSSPVVEKILGYKPEEIVGKKHFYDFFAPEIREELKKAALGAFKSKQPFRNFVNANINKSGHIVTLETSGTPILDVMGNLLGYRGADTDITERKRAEEEIKMLSSVVEQSTEGMAIAGLAGKLIFINEAWCKMHGYKSSKELLGKSLAISHNKEQMDNEVKPFNEKVMKLGAYIGEVWHITKEGKPFPTLMTSTLLKDKQGKPYALVGIAKDITEQKRAEETLKKSQQQMHMLLDSTAEAIYGIDLEGNCTFLNKACLRILGYDDDSKILGENMHNLIHFKYPDGSGYPAAKCKIYQAFKRGERVNVDEEVFWKADGTSFPAEYWSYPIKEEGKAIGAVVSFIDITERKKAEEMDHIRTDQIILNKEALLELTRMQTSDLETFSKIITLMSSQVLGVERVSVWFYNNASSEIICEALYILSKHMHEKGSRLRTIDYPKYFQALEEDPVLAVEDAHTDQRTNEFTEHYLKPLGISSMMDIPIRRSGKVIGVMCYESVELRQWTYEDQHFAASVAHIVTTALEDFERRKTAEALIASEQELIKRVNDLEDFYKMAVGRELRMKELKGEIAELKEQLEKYKSK